MLLFAALAIIQTLVGGTRLLFSLPAYGLLSLIGFLSLASLRRLRPEPDRICLWASTVFFAYIVIRAFLSPVPYLARTDIYSVLGGLLVYLFTAFVFTGARPRLLLAGALLAFAIVHVLVGAIQFRDGNNFMPIWFLQRTDYGRRASGLYVCPNHLAGLLEVLVAFGLSIVCWSRWPVWGKVLTAYAVAVGFAGIALTGSRGGYLSTAASLIVLIVLCLAILRQTGARLVWKIGLPGVVVVIALVAVLVTGIRQSSFLHGRAQNVADLGDIRLSLWQSAITEWKLDPIWGTGSGTFLFYARKFRAERVQSDPMYVHNDYLHLLCEYGIVGGVTFVLFLGAHARRGWQTFRQMGLRRAAVSPQLLSNGLALNLGALAAVSAYVVHSVFDFNLHIPANVLLMAFVFGVLANPGFERDPEHRPTAWADYLSRMLLPALALVVAIACVRYLPGEYFCERARTSLRDDMPVTAIKFALEGLKWETQNPDLYYYLGRARIDQADEARVARVRTSFLEAAIRPLEQGLALTPNEGAFQVELGSTFDALGRFAEAEWRFEEAIAWDPRWQWLRERYQSHLEDWNRSFPIRKTGQ